MVVGRTEESRRLTGGVLDKIKSEDDLGELHDSIEKMSLDETNRTSLASERRDRTWTVSTEGYGSMPSSEMSSENSRRCSELSGASQVSKTHLH